MPARIPDRIGRRAWMLGAGAGAAGLAGLAGLARAEGPAADPKDPEADAWAIREQGRKAGLGPFRSIESRHYRVIGDATEPYLRLILGDCEAVAADFLGYYRARGFEVDRPSGRLTAVVLADARAFAAFLGKPPDLDNGGRYDRASNRLTVFDYRPSASRLTLNAGFANRVFLAHEATHQLAFNTGLLDRSGDVPLCLSEGLAEFGEVRRPAGPSPPGRFNAVRLTDLARKRRQGVAWIPLPRLLGDDGPIQGSAGFDALILALAQGWLLAYHLMTDPALLPGFRGYLRAIRPRRDPARRLDDAREHLGDLDRLDDDLQRLSVRLLKEN
jgi:hypothetical protein